MTSIDTTFDFRTDTPPGRDPDAESAALRRFHQLLWSKPLPNGKSFDLVTTEPLAYLHHRSDLGEFWLSSDAVIPTLKGRSGKVVSTIPAEETAAFNAIGYTIGAMMIWPGNRIDGKQTINGARGFHPRICDRFDLTLECIRRHYIGESSPLAETLTRYADYFALFDDFAGFVDFFLLQDHIDGSTVRIFTPFDDFKGPAAPQDLETYLEYRRLCIEFIQARNARIAALGL